MDTYTSNKHINTSIEMINAKLRAVVTSGWEERR